MEAASRMDGKSGGRGGVEMKTCSRCGETKDKKEFNKHIDGRDGLRPDCKPCVKAVYDKWKEENKDKVRESHNAICAKYRAAHPDKVKESGTKWTAKNSEKVREMKANWYAKNADSEKAKGAKRAKENPEGRRISAHNRRAKKQANGGNLSKDLSAKLFKLQKGKCPCCGNSLGNAYHLDHIIPLHLGGQNIDSNIQLLRSTCNQQKHAKHPIDFMQSRGFLL